MKKLLFLLFIIPLVSFGQSSFCNGWTAGYQKGLESCMKMGVTPVCPIPKMLADTYGDGYGLGYKKAKEKCNNESSSSSSGAYANPKVYIPTADDPSFMKGFNQAFQQGMSNMQAINNANAQARTYHDNNANNSPEIDFNRGNYKTHRVNKKGKKYKIKYFLPQYWEESKKVQNADLFLGRQYANGRILRSWISIVDKINNINPRTYISNSKSWIRSKSGFKKQFNVKFNNQSYSSEIFFYEADSNFGATMIGGMSITFLGGNNYLQILFEINPISSDFNREYLTLAKSIEYLLGNISIQ